jgi:hypothetical protein
VPSEVQSQQERIVKPLEWYQIVLPIAVCLAFAALAIRKPRYRFVLMGLVALVGYAMLQDQVSARLCPEYFTVLHPPIPELTDLTILGISWGFLGAWWGGIVLGLVMSLVATLGPRPSPAPRELVCPLCVLVGVLALVTALTGFTVWRHAHLLGVALDSPMAEMVPRERHRELLTVACYHLSAYVTATVGGVVLCMWVWAERCKRARHSPVHPISRF